MLFDRIKTSNETFQDTVLHHGQGRRRASCWSFSPGFRSDSEEPGRNRGAGWLVDISDELAKHSVGIHRKKTYHS